MWLRSILAFRPGTAEKPWTYYEKIDAYLGPWGLKGYPLSYGLKYCKLFYTDRVLNGSAVGAKWVRRTLLLLQTELNDAIIGLFKAGALAKISSEQFTELAFDSHPRAYTGGGLSLVTLLAPELLGQITFIPRAEFSPFARTFSGTLYQVLGTARLLVPEVVGIALTGAVGEAATGNLKRAIARDLLHFRDEHRESNSLVEIAKLVRAGRVDHFGTLQVLRRALTAGSASGPRMAALALQALTEIDKRQHFVRLRYLRECVADPSLTPIFKEFDPDAWSIR